MLDLPRRLLGCSGGCRRGRGRRQHGRAGGDRARGLVVVHVEEDEIARLGGGRRARLPWLERGIERLHAIDRRARLGAPAFGARTFVEGVELLDRLGLLRSFRDELVGEHQADVVLIGTEIGELLERAKRLVELAGLLHPVGVLEEVLLRVVLEAFLRADLAELVVDRVRGPASCGGSCCRGRWRC